MGGATVTAPIEGHIVVTVHGRSEHFRNIAGCRGATDLGTLDGLCIGANETSAGSRKVDGLYQRTRRVVDVHVNVRVGADAGGSGRRKGFPVKAIVKHLGAEVLDMYLDMVIIGATQVATDVPE